jgi:hypothetical protein
MTFTILSLTAAYALVATLLAYLVLWSRLHLVFKALATAATIALIPLTFNAIGELRGLPSDSPIPPRFSMLWAQIVEPNLLLGEKGRVFLWIQTLDEENYPIGQPRAYQLPYSDDLNVKVSDAMAQISQGVDVQGTVETDAPAPDETAEELALDIELGASEMNPGGSSGVGERIFQFDPSMLTFGIGEAPVTPGKAP